MESDQREHSVDKGETLKVKIPFAGTGPFSFKLKKGNREIPDSDRVKLIPFEDYVVLQIKGTYLRCECGTRWRKDCLVSVDLELDDIRFWNPVSDT